MVGRSFRNANQPTVIGRPISDCRPWSRDFDSVSGRAPLDESAPGWNAITARVESYYPTELGTSMSVWEQRGAVL